MQKLKSTIEQYGRWSELSVYINRIETHLESDFSHSLENAKALLEAIGKNICAEKSHVLPSKPSVNVVLKNAFFDFAVERTVLTIKSILNLKYLKA